MEGNYMTKETGFAAGLEGVIANTSEICYVYGEEGRLIYHGYDIHDLVNGGSSFEEVIYLLWHGELPTQAQLKEFSESIASQRELNPDVLAAMKQFPKDANPMDVLRTAVSVAGLYDVDTALDSREANVRKATRLVAQVPTMVTTYERLREGKEPITPDRSLSMAASFFYLLNGEKPDAFVEKAFNTALILHAAIVVGKRMKAEENDTTTKPTELIDPNEPVETNDIAVEYKGAYLLISNRYDAPSEVMGAWLKRWRIEVLFRTAKQELGMLNCHSPNENHIHAHLTLLLTAETLVRYITWEQKTAGEEDCTHGQVIRNLLCIRCRTRQATRQNEQNPIVIDLDTPAKRFARLLHKFWPSTLELRWFEPSNTQLLRTTA
jgi:hypothetical protein